MFSRKELQLNGIRSPFPWWVWVVIGIAGFAVYTLLLRNGKSLLHGNCLSWKSIFLWLKFTCLFVDQPVPERQKSRELRNFKLWFCWAVFCLVISHAYRGFLFSSLATDTIPSTPQTLRELVESGILIGTTEVYISENFSEESSLIHHLPGIILGEVKAECQDIYSRLQASLFWLIGDEANFSIQASQNKTALVGPSKMTISIPQKFAVIDPTERATSIKSFLEEAGIYWASELITEQKFVDHVAWCGHYNYL